MHVFFLLMNADWSVEDLLQIMTCHLSFEPTEVFDMKSYEYVKEEQGDFCFGQPNLDLVNFISTYRTAFHNN